MRLRFVFTALLLITLGIAQAACSGAGSSAAGDETAALVNGKPITLEKVDQQLEQQAKGQNVAYSPVEIAAARMQILDNLITQEVLFQRAERENLLPSEDDVVQELARRKRDSGLSEEDFQKQMKESGLNEDQLREEIRVGLAISKLQQQATSKLPNPSDREINDFYNANKQRFVVGRGLALSVITVDAANNGARNDAIGNDAAIKKIETIYNGLKNGDDFATVARIQSEDPNTYQLGGDLGFIDEGTLKQQLGEQRTAELFGLREGQYTKPIEGSAGRWHIFKVTSKKTEPESLQLDNPSVRKQISDTLISQRQQILYSALISEALGQSKIENLIARRILQNPVTFGALRPSKLQQAAPPQTQTPPPAAPGQEKKQ